MTTEITKDERIKEIREHLFEAGKYRDLESAELGKAWAKINRIIMEDKK